MRVKKEIILIGILVLLCFLLSFGLYKEKQKNEIIRSKLERANKSVDFLKTDFVDINKCFYGSDWDLCAKKTENIVNSDRFYYSPEI